MKKLKAFIVPIMALLFLSSCVSVRVASDYDKEADFDSYKTYAFYKTGIDKAQISDLDKKRILKAIDAEMSTRGFTKSQNPDLLVSIFTKEKEKIDIYNGYWGGSYGWGWNPYYGHGNNVYSRTEGSLYIDLIDTKNKELVWQGKGVGTLSNSQNIEKKEQRIREFVSQILQKYPPNLASN
ncbi:MAG: hypothetical protein COA50_00125 [Flavobacteriaceae bacterium]|nr:MAG: hypothetical protein COA50_00125 [Flavobacteriaceae bacterium]